MENNYEKIVGQERGEGGKYKFGIGRKEKSEMFNVKKIRKKPYRTHSLSIIYISSK